MTKTPRATRCPRCGRLSMKKVLRAIETKAGRKRMVVPDIEVEECQRCGERLYDLAALRKIRDARGPARGGRAA